MSHALSMVAVTGDLCSKFLTLKSLEVKHKPVLKNEVPNIFLKKIIFLTFLFAAMSSTLN